MIDHRLRVIDEGDHCALTSLSNYAMPIHSLFTPQVRPRSLSLLHAAIPFSPLPPPLPSSSLETVHCPFTLTIHPHARPIHANYFRAQNSNIKSGANRSGDGETSKEERRERETVLRIDQQRGYEGRRGQDIWRMEEARREYSMHSQSNADRGLSLSLSLVNLSPLLPSQHGFS